MVISKQAVLVLAVTMLVIVALAQLAEVVFTVRSGSILMAALLLFAGGVGGWFARHHRVGIVPPRRLEEDGPTQWAVNDDG